MLSHQEQVIQMMKLAMWCLLNDGGQRPNMSTVIKVLEGGMSIETTILHRFLNTNTVLPLEDNPTMYSVQPQASILSFHLQSTSPPLLVAQKYICELRA
uniref:Uncharacterized protein n=1 Tax=Aegilops tauschii subsp. strangulata TaxID=200361 RepID=A0A452XK31_AEGTS